MADQEINLIFNADTAEGAASQIDELNTSLGENAEAAEESAKKQESLTESLSSMATGLNAAFEMGNKLVEGLQAAGAEYTRQSGIINNFRGSIEETSDRINGLISNIDLMQASSRLAAAGIQLVDHDLANVAVAAQQYSQRTGTDLNQSFEQLTEALNSGSSEAMNRFGISTGGATDKAEGQRNAIADLNTQYGQLDASVTGATGTMTTMSVAIDNATTQMIAQIEASTTLSNSVTSLSSEFTGLMTDLGLIGEDFDIVKVATDGLIIGIGLITERTRLLISAFRELAAGNFEQAVNKITESMDTLGIVNRLVGTNAIENATNDALAAIERAQSVIAPTVSTVTPNAPAARTGGGGGSRASREASELAAIQAENDRSHQAVLTLRAELEAGITDESEEQYRVQQLTTLNAENRLLHERNITNQLEQQKEISTAQNLAWQERNRLQEAQSALLARQYEDAQYQRQLESEQEMRDVANNTARFAMQDTINQSAQTIYNAEEQRQQRKTDLQRQYNQAVADGDQKKAAATKAEMKALGGAGKAIKEAMKAQLKSFAIQTGFKAIAAGAEALGLAAVGNFPGAALKGTEAAELAAVASLAGGAAAAIPKGKSGGGSSGAEAKPSGGSTGPGSEGNVQAAPIIVNIVGQTYVTQAQVGEAIIQATNAAKARY